MNSESRHPEHSQLVVLLRTMIRALPAFTDLTYEQALAAWNEAARAENRPDLADIPPAKIGMGLYGFAAGLRLGAQVVKERARGGRA